MPRRQGKLSVYKYDTVFLEGTRFPVKKLVWLKDCIFFEQDFYSNSEGQAEQEVSDKRVRVKVRYTNDIQPNQVVHYLGSYYKVWRIWSDGRKYLEIYLSTWDYNSDGKEPTKEDIIQ